MVMQIRTTGVDDYIDGSANIKMLVIGGPAAGKTRSSSFWPKPIYADTENGRGSIADRNVPYTEVRSSTDMLDFLAYLKGLENKPKQARQFNTVVIDTLDGFQRKVKDEWLQNTKSQSFKGYEAWGYLDSVMTKLMTRLLNLDYNVLVLCHYKDKTVRNGEVETHELGLQLQGDIASTAFNDFDLVGWLGTYWDVQDGDRVERRGLSFQRTPTKPFLKDRFGVMPDWVPITFADTDYSFVLEAFLSRVDSLRQGELVGEIGSAVPDEAKPTPGVLAPSGGALPEQAPREVPLQQLDRVALAKLARDRGVTTTLDGQAIRGNTTKGELLAALEKANEPAAAPAAKPVPAPSTPPAPPAPSTPPAPPTATPTQAPAVEALAQSIVQTDAGSVDAQTGEVLQAPRTHEQVVIAALETLGGEVVSDQADAPLTPPAAAAAAPESDGDVCAVQGCQEVLSAQPNPGHVPISYIRFRARYCNAHFNRARQLNRPLTAADA